MVKRDEVWLCRVFWVPGQYMLVLGSVAFPRRADPPAELAGVRRQLGDGRQNRVSLLEDGVVPASASRLLGDSDLKRLLSQDRRTREDTPEPNARRSSSQITVRGNRIDWASACDSWRLRRA